jgi:hypothetical protein
MEPVRKFLTKTEGLVLYISSFDICIQRNAHTSVKSESFMEMIKKLHDFRNTTGFTESGPRG